MRVERIEASDDGARHPGINSRRDGAKVVRVVRFVNALVAVVRGVPMIWSGSQTMKVFEYSVCLWAYAPKGFCDERYDGAAFAPRIGVVPFVLLDPAFPSAVIERALGLRSMSLTAEDSNTAMLFGVAESIAVPFCLRCCSST